jgi:hypothetical protein
MAGGEVVAARSLRLGFWRNGGEVKPSCAGGSSLVGLGRAQGRWFASGASRSRSSPAALMAGGGGGSGSRGNEAVGGVIAPGLVKVVAR